MKKFFVACCLFLCAASADATKVRSVELQELAGESELIVQGQIQLSQLLDDDCGVRYVIRVEETFKGNIRPGASLLFSSGKPLTTGSRYVLFLSKEGAAFEPLVSTNSLMSPDPERARKCKQIRPRYTVNVWGKGALKITGTYESSTRLAVFDNFMIVMPKGSSIKKLKPNIRYDVDDADGAMDFEAFRKVLRSKTKQP